MTAADNRTWILVALAVLVFFILPGINHGAWRPDEPRVAGTCAEMARTGDYVVPHLNGKPFLEKPPLYYALGGLSGALFGVDWDVPYRVVSLLFALLALLATWAMASRRDGPLTGLAAAGILASSWGFFMLARWIQVDIALVFGVTLAMYSYVRLTDKGEIRDAVILGLAAGTAFMAKGFVGPAIIAAAVLADIIRRRDLGLAWRIRPFTVAGCAAVVILPWVLALWAQGGWPFIREVIVVNNIMRFTGAPEGAALGHQNNFFFYFGNFPSSFAPWTLLFIPAVAASVRRFRHDPYVSWFIGPFVLLLLSSTKRGIYLVPLYPAAACMTAHWLVNRTAGVKWENALVWVTRGLAVIACFVPFVLAVVAWFSPFEGVPLGSPLLGVAMGGVAVSCLFLVRRMRLPEALSLTVLVCTAMFSLMTVYYQYLKPNEDYIRFTREALAHAQGRDITILGADEVVQGILPMITGKTYTVVPSYTDILPEGVYIWADRRDKVLRVVSRHADVRILHENRMDLDGTRITRLAYITPRISKSSEFSVPPAAAPESPSMPEPDAGEEGKAGY